ncbi:MAG: histidinol phosphate phosphatase [Anaerolineaceae bacterium]|nr:histidinol phosphate phosphatase [Anaerolineaceae bacterium]
MAVAATGAIFLDRDGVINENRPDHVKCWEEFDWLPNVLTSIRQLTETGLPIFVVTNQAIVNRGTISEMTLYDIHTRMLSLVNQAGGHIEKVYYCPHDKQENCTCRKPQPGMLKLAAEEHNIDLTKSFIVGDAWTDMEAGLAVGATGILVMTGRGRGQGNFARLLAHAAVRIGAACDLADATTIILNVLNGEPMTATPRLRRAFHMALSPNELTVL